MDDLIRRADLLNYTHDVTLANGAKHRCIDATAIHEIPAVDAEIIRHGRWVVTWERLVYSWGEVNNPVIRCSVCGRETDPRYRPARCICGAKMDLEEEDE